MRTTSGLASACGLTLLVALASAVAAADPADEARAAIEPVFAEISATARDTSLSPRQKRALIEHDLTISLDLGTLALAALGASADSFTKEQLAEFNQEFERFVLDAYLRRIVRFRDSDVEIQSATWDEKRQVAIVRILGGASLAGASTVTRRAWKPRANVDYLLRQRRGEWRIVAIRIEGVDMARFYGDQFRTLLARGGPDALIGDLRARNAEREADNPFEAADG